MTTLNASKTLPQSGPRHQMSDEREHEHGERDDALRPARAPDAEGGLHAARASATGSPVTLAYTSSRRVAIVGHA